jgi:hypothetical protein
VGRDTGGYPKMPGGLGRRGGSVGPNEKRARRADGANQTQCEPLRAAHRRVDVALIKRNRRPRLAALPGDDARARW